MTAVRIMPDPLPFAPLPVLRGERVLLRGSRDSDIEDRLRHPIDPEEEDGYGSAWRREWDGRRYHTREHLAAARRPEPGVYRWAVEHNGCCVGSAGLRVDAGQHRATYSVGLFVAARPGTGPGDNAAGRGLGLRWPRAAPDRAGGAGLQHPRHPLLPGLWFPPGGSAPRSRARPGRLERPHLHGFAALGIRVLKRGQCR